MITKKGIFHYLVYVIFALIFFCSIGLYAVKFQELSGGGDILVPLVIKYLIVFAGSAVLIFGYRLLVKYLPEKYIPKIPKLSKNIELIGVAVFVIFALLARMVPVVNSIGADIDSVYYSYALGNSIELPSSIVSVIYAFVCRILYSIISGPYLIYAFNGLIQIGVIILTYYTVKCAFRIRYAILSSLFLSFLPSYIESVTKISADGLICLIFVLFLYFFVLITDKNKKGKLDENVYILLYIAMGVFAGMMAVCDILGVAAYFMGLSIIIFAKNENAWINVQKSWYQVLMFSIAFVASTVLLVYFVPIDSVNGIEGIVKFGMKFVPTGLSLEIPVALFNRPENITVYLLAQIAIFSFIRNDEDYGLVYALLADFAAIFTFIAFKSSDYSAIMDYCFVLFAAIGVFSIPSFVLSKEEIESNREKKRNKEVQKEKKQFEKENKKGAIRLSLNPENDIEEEGFSSISFDTAKAEDKAAVNTKHVDAPPEIPKELIQPEKESPKIEVVKKEAVPLVKIEPVLPEEQPAKNVIPSRREYKTAHVYKNEEERAIHESKMNEPVVTSVNTDASLKEKPAAALNGGNSEEVQNRFIKNVLPTPKPHTPKELSFDFDPSGSDMDYDINDLKGKDFYDI